MLLLSALTEPKADLRDLAGTIPGFDFSPVFRSGHFEWVAPTVEQVALLPEGDRRRESSNNYWPKGSERWRIHFAVRGARYWDDDETGNTLKQAVESFLNLDGSPSDFLRFCRRFGPLGYNASSKTQFPIPSDRLLWAEHPQFRDEPKYHQEPDFLFLQELIDVHHFVRKLGTNTQN